MMNSGVDDDFPPNPFRSDGGGGGDFLNTQQPAPQQQPPFMQQPPQQQQYAQPPPQQQYAPQQQAQFHPTPQYQQPPQATMGGAMDPTTPTSTPTSWWGLCMACVRLETYKKYFDVDTDDIRLRMTAAMTHFHQPQYFRDQVVGAENQGMTMNSTANVSLKGPDLYGPVWITFVLILLVAATANWSASLRYKTDLEEFEYDINHLLHAWSFLTAFVFGIPTVLWLSCRCMSLNALTLAEWICFYGYSMVPYLPASIVCIIPVNFIAWVVLFAASAASALLVLRNASVPLLASDPSHQKAPPLILFILVAHFIFFVSIVVTFYHHGKVKHSTPSTIAPSSTP